MWELDHKEDWALKKLCFQIVVLEKTLESPSECKEIKVVYPKINQPWIFIERTDAEAEAPILWPPDEKGWLIGKDPDAEKDWRQKEKGMTEDEMVGWHHWLNGHEFEQATRVGDGQGGLACFSPWVAKSWTWLSDWTELITLNDFHVSYGTSYHMSICMVFFLLMGISIAHSKASADTFEQAFCADYFLPFGWTPECYQWTT